MGMLAGRAVAVGLAVPCTGCSILAAPQLRISEHRAQGPCRLWPLPASQLRSRLGLPLQAPGPVLQLQRTRTGPRGTSVVHALGLQPALPHPALCRALPVSKPSPM